MAGLAPIALITPTATSSPAAQARPTGAGFSDLLGNVMDQVRRTAAEAQTVTQQVVSGQAADLSRVIMVSEKASLTLELATQLRNKMLDAYQEIMRMPV